MVKLIYFGIVALLLCSTMAHAGVRDDSPLTGGAQATTNDYFGGVIQANVDANLTACLKSTLCQATKCTLYGFSNETAIATASFSGHNATFSPPVRLDLGEKYYILAHADGGSYERVWEEVGTPYAGTNINWTDGAYDQSGFTTTNTYFYSLEAVYSDEVEAPAPPGDLNPDDPTFSGPTPSHNTVNNTQPTYNVTHPGTDINYFVYVDDVIFMDNVSANVSGSHLTWGAGFTEGNHTVDVSVQNISSGLFSNNISGSFIYDVSIPTLTTSYINKSVFSDTLSGSFNFSDNLGLHSVNFSVDGTPVFNTSGINDLTYNYSLNYPLGSLNYGWHNLTVFYADGHTAKKLKSPKDYNPSNGLFNDYIKYTFTPPYKPASIKIKGAPGSVFDYFDTEEKTDRYKIKYKPNSPGGSYSFRVETSEKMFIYDNHIYGGNWIIAGEHWLDFYVEGQPGLNVVITKINDYEADVLVSGIDPLLSEIDFNSIGDLNDVTETYTFFYANVTMSYTSKVIAGESQTIVLNVTSGDEINTSANLIYNNTARSSVKTTHTGYDLYTSTFTTPAFSGLNTSFNISWNYTVAGPGSSNNGHVNASNEVYNYQMDNCSQFHTHALNITFIDLDDYEPTDVEVIFQSTGDASYYYQNTNGTANLSICIYPGWANQSDTLAIQYDSADTYYYNSDINLSNVTQLLTLYVQDTAGVTTFTIKDKSTGATLEDVYMTMYRKINGTFQVIQSKYSDITGRVQFGFDTSAEYQFFLSKSGYEPYDFILNPIIFDSYDVLMTPTFSTNQTWDYDRIGLLHEPEIFYNDQVNNFTFFIHSPYAELLTYSYTLTYPGGTSTNSGASPVGEQLKSDFTITGANPTDKVYLTYSYETTKSGNRSFNYAYEVIMTGNNTMFGNRNQTYGLGLFERLFISVFFVFLAVGIATLVGQPLPGLGLGLLLYGYFVYIGFLPIWTVLITISIGLIFLGARPDG